MKRLLTGVLVVCMLMTCLFLLPDEAQAAAYYDNTQTEPAYVAQNTTTGAMYADVTTALTQAQAGQTVVLLTDATADMVSVYEDICLDLAGRCLTVKYFSCFGDTVDTSANNAGLLVADHLMFTKDNDQLPVGTEEGYRFVEVERIDSATLNNGSKYAFQLVFEEAAHAWLAKGYETSGVRVLVNVSWNRNGNSGIQRFVYSDELVKGFVSSYANGEYGKMFTLTLQNSGDFQDLSFDVCVESFTGVSVAASDEDELPVSGNVVTKDTTITNEQGSAMVPAGTLLVEDAKKLVLTTTKMEETTSDVELGENEAMLSMDVHVVGVSEENTKPILVTLNEVTLEGLNEGNIALYHVENGVTNKMTRVYSIEEVDEHNEFYYDIPTGTITMALMSFSEVAVVADEINAWNGKIADSIPVTEDGVYEIFNADQLAKFGQMVDGGNTFEGKTVRMMLSVNLGYDASKGDNNLLFNPIGYGYEFKDGQVFKGTFDGNGNTVYNMYMNGWDLEAAEGKDYTYSMAGAGLFASVVDATIKNLTVDGAYIKMECVDMGVVVGYANGNCTFENLVVKNSKIANYQRATGGAIGEVANGHHILKNVDVETTTYVSSLWGDFDASLGGIIGGKWGHNYTDDAGENGYKVSVYMEKCDVAAQINAYNDVTSAYQWYSYRRCGMLIGNTEESKTENGRTEATAPFLTTKECTVQYGDWATYHYCEFTNTDSLDARYPWVRVEGSEFNGAYSNPRYGNPAFGANKVDDDNHTEYHTTGDGHNTEIVFNQLYGGGQGCYGGNSHVNNGVTVIGNTENQTKFESKDVSVVKTGTSVKLGDLFKGVEGANIQSAYVYAFVSPVDDKTTARGTQVVPTADGKWEDLTITFSGAGNVTVTISDYYYCNPTTIDLVVKDYKYTITYINDGKQLDIVYVADNSIAHSTENVEAANQAVVDMGSGYAFSHWMNAGSTRVDSIDAGNTENVTLYPSFVGIYSATFVEQDGTVIAWCTYTQNDTTDVETLASNTRPKNQTEEFVFEKWQVQVRNDNGTVTKTDFDSYKFRDNKDITIYPIYTYNGSVSLNPIDTNGDGEVDAYEVTGYSNGTGSAIVEIPDKVNGLEIVQISANAFSSYEHIHAIVIPKTIGTTGDNVLATDWGFLDSGETVTIYYQGSYQDWLTNEPNFGAGWDDGLGTSSRVFFVDENGKVDVSQGYLQFSRGLFASHGSWSAQKTITSEIKQEYDCVCDCKDLCKGQLDRPDRKFWTDVVVG